MPKIVLMQDKSMEKVDIARHVNTWNDQNDAYTIVEDQEVLNHPDAKVWFINVHLTKEKIKKIENNLRLQPDTSVCFFVEMKELRLLSHIRLIDEMFPFAKIGTIAKPIQYMSVENFLESVQSKKEMVEFDAGLDDIDWEEEGF